MQARRLEIDERQAGCAQFSPGALVLLGHICTVVRSFFVCVLLFYTIDIEAGQVGHHGQSVGFGPAAHV